MWQRRALKNSINSVYFYQPQTIPAVSWNKFRELILRSKTINKQHLGRTGSGNSPFYETFLNSWSHRWYQLTHRKLVLFWWLFRKSSVVFENHPTYKMDIFCISRIKGPKNVGNIIKHLKTHWNDQNCRLTLKRRFLHAVCYFKYGVAFNFWIFSEVTLDDDLQMY